MSFIKLTKGMQNLVPPPSLEWTNSNSVNAIKLLYLSEDISRIMPGKKDHCSNMDNERKNTFTKAPFTFQFKRCLLVFF